MHSFLLHEISIPDLGTYCMHSWTWNHVGCMAMSCIITNAMYISAHGYSLMYSIMQASVTLEFRVRRQSRGGRRRQQSGWL